jgi:hypothetical protein
MLLSSEWISMEIEGEKGFKEKEGYISLFY